EFSPRCDSTTSSVTSEPAGTTTLLVAAMSAVVTAVKRSPTLCVFVQTRAPVERASVAPADSAPVRDEELELLVRAGAFVAAGAGAGAGAAACEGAVSLSAAPESLGASSISRVASFESLPPQAIVAT